MRRLSLHAAGLRVACLLAAGLFAAPTALAQTAAPAWGLSALMREMAQVRAASASFTERKTSPLLSAPLLDQGTLSYTAPDYMRKTTLAPVPERFTLAGNRITMTGGPGGGTHVFPVSAAPQIGGLVEGIRATLAGDSSTLTRLYAVRLSGSAAGWQLLLRPRDAKLARLVQSIEIRGSQDRIEAIDTRSPDGGDSTMIISEAVTDAP
jgi:outer membrane lipoprotein-sorting protein